MSNEKRDNKKFDYLRNIDFSRYYTSYDNY